MPQPLSRSILAIPADHSVLSSQRRYQYVYYGVVALAAAATLLAWLVPDLPAAPLAFLRLMKVNTALSMLLIVASMLVSEVRGGRRRGAIALGLLAVPAFLAVSSLLATLGVNTGRVETMFAPDPGSAVPGAMAVETSVFIVLVCIGLAAGSFTNLTSTLVADAATLGSSVVALASLGAAVHDLLVAPALSDRTVVAPLTLVCMLAVCATLYARRTRYGVFSVIVARGPGGRIARLTLPFALLLPFVVIVVDDVLQLHGMSSRDASSLVVSVMASVMTLLVSGMAIRIEALNREVQELSITDELTGLRNHRGLQLLGEQLHVNARRTGTPLTALYFDLDGLKLVNDTLGHDAGSALIADAAALLRSVFRESDLVGRAGGDEFVVLARDDAHELDHAMRRLEAATADFNSRGDLPYRIAYSVGRAELDPRGTETLDALIHRADVDMYQRREQRRTRRDAAAPAPAPQRWEETVAT